MASIDFEIKGVDELIKQLEQLGERVIETQHAALQAGADIEVDVMRGNAPAGTTGVLKDSVTIGPIKGKGAKIYTRVGVHKMPNRYYAGYVEHGTHKMLAMPFIFPSHKQAAPAAQAAMQAVMKGAFI